MVGLGMSSAFGQEEASHEVSTVVGTFDIPDHPKRVICIDSRIDLEPAVALGLEVIGYSYDEPMPWVPVGKGAELVGEIPSLERILTLNPDLIICTYIGDGESEMWPARPLTRIAPVLSIPYERPWKEILLELGKLTLRESAADALLAEYNALIADIKARHGDKIARKKVLVVQPGGENVVYFQTARDMVQIQVLTDLGAPLPPAMKYPDHHIAAESFETYFGEADAFLYVLMQEGAEAATESNPLWSRLPAVAAGKVLKPIGNTNFGGVYTAIHTAKLFDELYSMLD
jgi:iron complex transport system substrate-binding protein